MSQRAAPRPGDVVGDWTLGPLLGQGGIASVYRAEGPAGSAQDSGAPGVAAVKILHAGRVTEEEVVRFRREFLTLQRLQHPNLVRVYDAGEANGFPWIAMELVEGSDLGSILERWEKDPPPDRFARAERIVTDLCAALAEVHRHGVVHRDLKPGNVLVDHEGRARLTDFGAIKDPDAFPTSLTVAGRLVGTVAFMAPEQILGDGAVDARADLYSLGAVLYALLTSRRPINADSIAGYLARHLAENPRPPSDIDPRVPARLERVCMRLLEKEPARRFPDADAVLAALRGEDAAAPRPFVGRSAELGVLDAALARLADDGVGGVVAVRGAPGSGRTRLLDEVALRVRSGNVLRVTGETLLVDLCRTWAADEDPSSGTQLGERVTSVGVIGEVARLRRGMGRARWVLLVDDVERAGPGALAVLAGFVRAVVAQEAGGLLVVFTAAPGEAGSLVSGTATGLPADEIVLGALDREAMRALMRDAGLPGPAGSVLARRMLDEAQGLPGPALDQIATLRDAGWLTGEDGGALRLAVPIEVLREDALPMPASVRADMTARLYGLDPSTRRVVDALAVLAAPAAAALVAAVNEVDEAEVLSLLRELVRAGHVTARADALHEVFVLTLPRLAQAVREALTPAEHARLHRACAAALLRLHRRRAGAVAEEAAAHLVKAGDSAGAWPLLVQAAARSARLGDWNAARRLGEQASAYEAVGAAAQPGSEGIRLRRQLAHTRGETARAQGHPREAARAFRQAVAFAREAGERDALALAAAGAGLAELAAGRTAEASGPLEEAWPTLQRGDPSWPELADAVASVRMATGNLAGARSVWTELRAFGVETRSTPAWVLGTLGLARFADIDGQAAAARQGYDEAVQRGRDAPGAETAWMRALHAGAERALEAGDTQRAVRLADALEGLAEHDVLAGVLALAVRTEALVRRGDAVLAQRSARELLGRLRMPGSSTLRRISAWGPAVRVLAATDEAGPAVERLQEREWASEPDAAAEPARLALLALALAPTRPVEARTHALAAVAIAQAPGERPAARARVEMDAAQALLRSDAPSDARSLALTALARLRDGDHAALVEAAARLVLATGPHLQAETRLRGVTNG